jgi:hypothetical protein
MNSTPTDFRGALTLLGSTRQAAALLGCQPRHLRRWRSGERTLPHGITLLLRLLAAGVITVGDIERAASARANDRVDPGGGAGLPSEGGAAALVEDSVVAKVLALADGECRWPTGDIPTLAFCGAPVTDETSSYCAQHRAAAHIPGTSRPTALVRLVRARLDQPPEIDPIDGDDAEILALARDRHEVVLELAP